MKRILEKAGFKIALRELHQGAGFAPTRKKLPAVAIPLDFQPSGLAH